MGRKSENTIKMIRLEASKVFAGNGYKNVTMSDICRATGLSRGGLYRYYSNTAEILGDIITNFTTNINSELNRAILNGTSPVILLDKVLDGFKKEVIDVNSSLSVAIYEYCVGSKENYLQQAYCNAEDVWEKFIEYGINMGEFNSIDPRAGAEAVIFSYEGLRMSSHVMKVSGETADGVMNMLRRLLVKEEK